MNTLAPPQPGVSLHSVAGESSVSEMAARVQSGDLWQLGKHRLLCGDCTDGTAVRRLMQSPENGTQEAADLLFLDPPYGVGYGRPLHDGMRRVPALRGDSLGDYGTYELLKNALLAAPLKPGGVFYVCSASGSNETLFRLAVRDAGLSLRQALIWVKQHFVLGRQDYHWQHECVLYGWKEGAAHHFGGGRKQTTVWPIARSTANRLHPTMKPLELVRRAIENSSRPDEIVYDGFGGSGTTLLACEATGRKCRMMEIEPGYCDVILQRWERQTGGRATLMARAGQHRTIPSLLNAQPC